MGIRAGLGTLLAATLAVTFLFLSRSDLKAQSPSVSGLEALSEEGGVELHWRGRVGRNAAGEAEVAGWPLVEIGQQRLPAQLVALQVHDAAPVAVRVKAVRATPWDGGVARREFPVLQTPEGERRPVLAREAETPGITSPVVVLREGRVRGVRLVVVAVSPLFEQDGAIQAASEIHASIPDATLFEGDATALLSSATSFVEPGARPPAPLSRRRAVRVTVSQAGMQRLSGAALGAAGLELARLDLSRLHLWHDGREVALEERGTEDARLDSGDELRFYAATPGDRWNSADTYWLTVEATVGARMARRDVRPGEAAGRTTGIERGSWQGNRFYDSRLPGPDGDHWFTTDLRTGPEQAAATVRVPLTPTLPLAGGSTTLTVTGSAYTPGQHQLRVGSGPSAHTLSWSGAGAFTHTAVIGETAQQVLFTLVPGAAPDGLLLDGVTWERAVTLDAGGRGATFRGVGGTWRYEVARAPDAASLYDVSDPYAPETLQPSAGDRIRFEDGPEARDYLLAGPGTLHAPTVAAHVPSDLAAPLDADVVYIAPAPFHAALAPLVRHRGAQGHTVRVVDVQAIYDGWSHGQVSPAAIREFLRYAAATWNRPPSAVLLVGDGTSDPRNYTRHNNINWVPPYLAMVDPWLGETACESCYAQLDGASPLDDPLPDLALGRLPVKNVGELEAVVAKIIGYETAGPGGLWRSRSVFIADNYRDANGNIDGGGDFARFADEGAALQPAGVQVSRVYYDPWRKDDAGGPLVEPWRISDAVAAYRQTIAALNSGAAIASYTGHSHYYQWASTDLAASPSYLLGLYDVDALTNGERLPILLEMTCLTSAFQQPAFSGTTIDERFLLMPDRGAVAVWGPTGLGIMHGHDALQRGFYKALRAEAQARPAVGALIQAGYLELFTQGGCCQDALRTFALLGDPLTGARVSESFSLPVYLPVTRR